MYKFMSEEEIKIGQINNLKMIHLYQLGGSDAIAVYYDEDKQINLCAMDANYNFLMERVLTLYSRYENKEAIIIDKSSKEVLEQAIKRGNNHTCFFNRIGEKYIHLEGSLSPKFASDGVMRETLLPMLKYYLTQLYTMWNMKITFEQEPQGWHRNCVLKIHTSDETTILPIRMNFSKGNECQIKVGNFLRDLCSIDFEISYREDQIYVLFESKEFELFGESHFEINSQNAIGYTTIRVEGAVVYHQDEPMERLLNSDADYPLVLHKQMFPGACDTDFTNASVYKLPWGGFIICKSIDTAHEQYKRTDYDIVFLEEYRKKLALRQYSYSLIENVNDKLRLRTDGAVMRKLCYGDRNKNVETLFLPAGYYSGWDYKEYLENKYFYHESEETK